MIRKIVKYLGVLMLITIVIMQFFRPEKNNGGLEGITAFKTETKPSEKIFSILKTNCFDCHSNQTNYPWYSEIAPISYWLNDHVTDGKKELNISDWDSYSIKKKDHKLEELIEVVDEEEMPLNSYTWIHGNLSSNNKELLLQWSTLARLQYKKELKISSK